MPPPPTTTNPTILLFGTCDTKLPELLSLKTQIQSQQTSPIVILLDIGRRPTSHDSIDIPQPEDLSSLPRPDLTSRLTEIAITQLRALYTQGRIHATISIGGSTNTSIAAAAMQVLPLGFPKVLVSTMVSGDVGHYVKESDVTLMYSVVDIAGLNSILSTVLENAAGAVSGMAWVYLSRQGRRRREEEQGGMTGRRKTKAVALSMFGNTTAACTVAQNYLTERGYEVYVLHATGAGGRVLERLVTEGAVDAVLDLTTTEIADEVVGGVLSAGPDRLTAAVKKQIPVVVSLGCLDMVNFGPPETVPEKFGFGSLKRVFVKHNEAVTIMRTNVQECEEIGRVILRNLRGAREGRVEVWAPKGGWSAVGAKGGEFWDPEANEALVNVLKEGLVKEKVKFVEREEAINDKAFAEAVAERLVQMVEEVGPEKEEERS